jgi:hypothetical protein
MSSEVPEAVPVQPENPISDQVLLKADWDGRQTDWLLQWFTKFVNNTQLQIGITLTVGGNLISGTLISHQTYFEQLALDFSTPFGGLEGVEPSEVRDMLLAFSPEPPAEGESETAFQFLHLKDAKVFSNADLPIAASGVLWRGKIAAVDGFNLGSLVMKPK